jgi:hypothetical protein
MRKTTSHKISLLELTPNERNPRRMSDQQSDALRKSLVRFGPLDGFIFNLSAGSSFSADSYENDES